MNLNYSIRELAQALDGQIIGDPDFTIKQVIIDSRNFFSDPNTLFIAIIGENNNGHDYINSISDLGCKNFIVESEYSCMFKISIH